MRLITKKLQDVQIGDRVRWIGQTGRNDFMGDVIAVDNELRKVEAKMDGGFFITGDLKEFRFVELNAEEKKLHAEMMKLWGPTVKHTGRRES
jgi:hypothetical protein